jgi:glycosyltransferase involved in cell wall biosynthesis
VRVGLNLLFLVPGETGGMEVYARELIPALRAADPSLELVAFVNREAAAAGGGAWTEHAETVVVPVRARNRVEWVCGEQALLPGLAARAGCALVHSLASTAPARGPFRRVVTVHDLIYLRHPEAHAGLRAWGMRLLVPLAAHRAHRVMADSQATRDDLVALLRLPPARIDVVPLAAPEPATAPTPEAELRRRLLLGERRLLLSASAKRPHKNLLRLLDAHALLDPGSRPLLVLPGYATDHEARLRSRAHELGIGDDVRFLGWLPAADLEGLYAASAAFVFPSLYEGFGLPVLEAMRRGLAVACSRRAALAEVAGPAARDFDPEDPADIARALRAVLDDPREAARLREAGARQAARFTWEATARGCLASYARALAA